MSYTPDPSMLLDPSLGLGMPSSGLQTPPLNVPPPTQQPMDDPVIKMFMAKMQGGPASQIPQGPAGTPMGQLAPGPGGPAPGGAPTPAPPPPKPVAVGNPAAEDKPGLFKRMLMNFAYSGSEALKHSIGMPTDQEIQAGDQKEMIQKQQLEISQQKADAETQRQTAYAQQNDLIDIAPTLAALGKTLPPGATVMVPRRNAGQEIKQQLANVPREQGNAIAARKLGYDIDSKTGTITPTPDANLSEMQRSGIDLNNASVTLKKAQADLATDPNNPVNKVKFQIAMQKMQQADQRLRIQEHNSARGDKALAFRMDSSNMGDPSDPNNQFARVTPAAQKILMTTSPVKAQITDLLNRIDSLGLKDNNTPGYLFKERVKYAMGMGSPEGELGSDISNISLASVVGAARILAGSSRAYPALMKAMEHTPNAWTGSPKQMKQQLEFMLKNVDDVEQDAVRYGRKGGAVPIPQGGRALRPGTKIRTAGSW